MRAKEFKSKARLEAMCIVLGSSDDIQKESKIATALDELTLNMANQFDQ